jgi:hypothetical protein
MKELFEKDPLDTLPYFGKNAKMKLVEHIQNLQAAGFLPTKNNIRISNYWVFGLCPSAGILETRKNNVSQTGSVSFLR